jgi:uncharacterized membrane protein
MGPSRPSDIHAAAGTPPMHFTDDVLSPGTTAACWLLAILVYALVVPGLRSLRGPSDRIHLVLGAALALALLWSMRMQLEPGIALHVLGIPAAVLVLGWRLAMVAALLAELALLAMCMGTLSLVPAGWLVSAALPGALTLVCAGAARFHLPRNPFVFIFVCAFFGAAFALLGTWIAGAALLSWSGQPLPTGPGASLVSFLPLVMLPEAFINGALISGMIVYRPEWVRLYDERFYHRF